MARKSARLIGRELGLSAQKVNQLLAKIGFIVRSPYVTMSGGATWDITELGRLHGEQSHNPYSFGFIWDDDIVDILRTVFKL